MRFLGIARGSNHELLAQVLILTDLKIIETDAGIIGRINYVGKMLTKLIQCLK
ncbi:MAG: four helix bundle protein [Planctomycetes bacterium]|nr:four helix bundle protein [Planctomycetota bacterium]